MLEQTIRRALASLLALCMLFTLLPVSALAEEGGEAVTVAAFEALDGAVAEQTVPFGTAREALNLPYSLWATVYTTAPDTEAVVIDGVTWEPDSPYEGAAGSYAFTASATGYICAEGVDWPVITIVVEEQPDPEPAAYDAALALFAALPAPAAVADMTDGEKDALSAQLGRAADALLALPGEDYDRFMAEHAAYLENVQALRDALTGGAETTAAGHAPEILSKNIYANGVAIRIEAGTTTDYTNIRYDSNGDGTVEDSDLLLKVGSGISSASAKGYDLSEYAIIGGTKTGEMTGSTNITMTGGKVNQIFGGGGADSTTTGGTSVTITGGTVVGVVCGGGGANSTVTGDTSVTITGGAVVMGGVDGGGVGSTVTGGKTVTLGGGVQIGGETSGIVINGGTGPVTNGVDSFAIGDALTGSVHVILPAGYGGGTIATGAVAADLEKIKLAGGGAAGNEAYFEDGSIKVRAERSAHTHCVCGGGVSTGGHTSHSDLTWTAWTSNNSLPTSEGSYYLTTDVTLTDRWTTPAAEVNLCLNGKKVTATHTNTKFIMIPQNGSLTISDCQGNGAMEFTSTSEYGTDGIYGDPSSAFSLYGGSIGLTRNKKMVANALRNNGGTFAVHGGTVSATHGSSGADKTPYAYGVYTEAGTTTLWGGGFEAKVTNTTAHTDGNSGAYGARVLETGVLRLAGAPTFTASNSANNKDAAAIYASAALYAHAENTPFSGNSVSIQVSSTIARNGGLVVREVDNSNKGKFTVANTTSLTLTEVTEDGKTHLALTGPYTVAFNANGGTGSMTSQSFDGYSHSQALTENTLTKTGYAFTGWNTKSDGSGTSYADKAAVSALVYGGAVTLYAQWEEAAAYTVSVSVKEQPPYCKNDEIFLMANVKATDSGAAMTTGKVQFYKGDATLGSEVSYSATSSFGKQKGFALSVICGSSNFIPELSVGDNIIKAVYTPSGGGKTVTSEPFTVTVSDKENGNKYISSMTMSNRTGDGVNYVSLVQFGVSNNGGNVGIKASEFVITGTRGGQPLGASDFQVEANDSTATVKVKDPGTYVFTAKLPDNSAYVGVEVSDPVEVLAPYTVTYTLEHLTAENQPATVNYGNPLTATLSAAAGYKLPETITVTMGGTTLALNGDTGYTYNSATGKVGIDHVTGNVVVTAAGAVKSADATLSALTYKVGSDGRVTAVPSFAAATATYDVTLPAGTAAGAAITLTGTPAAGASITTNAGVTLSGGSGTATLTVTAEDGTTTKTYTVSFVTTPAAPAATAAVIDYPGETISFADAYEMNTKADFTGATISSGASITGYISNYGTAAQTLYLRVKAAGNVPASAATAVTIPARPQSPDTPTYSFGDTTINVSYNGTIEHTIDGWTTINTGSYIYEGLNPGTDYTLKFRVPATGESFKSEEGEVSNYTAATIQKPTVSEPGKGSAEADKPSKRRGKKVTYTVTFTDGWTPTLTLSGNHNTLSDPVKGANNTWTYTYVVHKDDKIIAAALTFAQPQIESVSYTGEAVALFADSEHNASADALAAYLAETVKVTPTYDNGATGEAVAAAYELKTGTWAAKGGTYTYTATAGGQTCDVPVAVKAVTAAVGAVDGITKVRTAEGYTTHAALGLLETVTITYTGEGYTERTDTLAVSWDAIPQNFGKTPGNHTFTGVVALPAWATGSTTTTATVTISDKTALTDGQMTLTMDGWTYGETAKLPTGSVTVTADNGGISYQYSADGGATWADTLPTSTAGVAKAGTYQVRMNYEGDAYIGTKTASFTVAQKAVTLGTGTLAASKTYDGTTTATLTGAPAITGLLDRDTVTATGGSGVYATADAGTGIAVTVTGCTLTGADAGNYSTTGAVSGLTGTITPAEGANSSGYAAALEALKTVHIVTNVTPTLAGVTLPDGWAFTGDTTARITASNGNSGKQSFPVRYTPESANYAPVTLTGDDALFPVSTVALEVNGGLDMKTIESIGGTLTLSPVALKVTGAALPASGDYAITNMEWSSSVERIATVTGSVAASNMTATITAVNKGVTMVGVAYKNGGGMLGYVLVQVVGDRTDSANTVEDITSITETLDKLIDPQSPSETDKKAVDAVADEVTKLPDAAKEALTLENVKALDALKEAVGKSISDESKKLTITIEDDAEGQVPAPTAVEVVGAAIACGVDSGNVVVTVKPVQPTGSDTKLELKMEMTVGGTETQLAAPMFFRMDVPEGIDLENLKLYHVKDDGNKTELPHEKGEGRTISFKMMSFSSVQFVVSTGGTSGGTTGGSGGTTAHTLTATAGEGGKITPSGKVRVTRNSDKTFTITPAEGYEIADVLVDGKSVGAVSTYTFEKVKANHTIAASFRAEDERPAWNPFTDVKEGAWYYDSVKYVYERGLMNGTGRTTFSPGLSTTRGMIVTILWRLEQSPESGAAMAFTDVKAGSYCYEAVRWAAEHEIVKGYTSTTFGPDNTITRQELAAILYRYAQYKGADMSAVGDLTAFTDHPDPWAEDAVKWAVGAGILNGKGGGILDPKGQATRAQVAAMLIRFISAKAN